MKDELVVYAYNVLFGDAILIEIPDDATKRFILIDVGNAKDCANKPLLDAMDDVIAKTKGRIDLYVMTHEHMDHVQGLLAAASKGRTIKVGHVWMTSSSAPDYYAKHPKARKQKLALEEAAQTFAAALGPSHVRRELSPVLRLNTEATDDCIKHIRKASGRRKPHYVDRASALRGMHPFRELQLRVLAPERDTSVYYGTRPPRLALAAGARGKSKELVRPLPLPGIDGQSFYELIDQMNAGLAETLFAIDKAENNTSLVVELEWRKRRLLFTGDAEQKSWRTMSELGLLKPVDLLKIGHHGSINATPPPPILDEILPRRRRGKALAVVSTCNDVYPGVPASSMKKTYSARTKRLYDTRDVKPGKPVEIRISAGA
jgi:beta-lactamase superfamily II metal-dependent hydrolase